MMEIIVLMVIMFMVPAMIACVGIALGMTQLFTNERDLITMENANDFTLMNY